MEITNPHLEIYEVAGAPQELLDWARETSRTYGQLTTKNLDWVLWVVQNGTTPEGVLSFYKSNPNWEVRMFVALNACSEKVLTHLIKDKHEMVRAALAENVNLTDAIVGSLKKDPEELVSDAAIYFWPPDRLILQEA